MPTSEHDIVAGQPLSALVAIERACDDFESAWRSEARPEVAEYLSRVSGEARPALLRALLAIELVYRRERRETPDASEYMRRFPGFEAIVGEVFAESEAQRGSTDNRLLGRSTHRPAAWPSAARREAAVAADDSSDGTLKIRCPHCRRLVDLADDAPADRIQCPVCRGSFSVADDEALTGERGDGASRRRERFGHFELVEQVGAGAFGAVWKARDTLLDRTVALKIPSRGRLTREESERVLREARAAAQLRHPNIVGVHEVGIERETLYIVSDFVDGTTLSERLSESRFSHREAARLCVQFAEAVHYAHQQGIIHRDLKPANIMLDAGDKPMILDFGLAKREMAGTMMTLDGQIMGTPAYMSPEQARGDSRKVDRRTDVYSLGVILFELLTGELPFRGNLQMLVKQVIEDDPPRLRKLDASVPRDLETICLKCLAKTPGGRYSSAQELADDLSRFLDGRPVKARPVGPARQAWRWCRRNPVVASLAGGVAASLLLGIAVSFHYALEADRRADEAQNHLASARAAQADAQQKTRLAESAAARAAEAERLARREAEAARREACFSYIALAERCCENAEFAEARRCLDLCPVDLRRWEWHYLKEVADLRPLRLGNHRHRIDGLAFSSDGRLVATGGLEGEIKTWRVESGRHLLTLDHQDAVCSLAFGPDARTLASWGPAKRVVLWDLDTGAALWAADVDTDSVAHAAFAFSPDGKWIATKGGAGAIHLRSAADGSLVREFPSRKESVKSLAFSPDSTQLAAGSGGTELVFWDVATAAPVRVIPRASTGGHGITALAYSADGRWLVTGENTRVRVRDAATGEESFSHGAHHEVVRNVGISADGRYALSSSWDRSTVIYDSFERRIATRAPFHASEMSPDGLHCVSSDQSVAMLWRWQLRTVRMVAQGKASHYSNDVLAVVDDDRVRFFDAAGRRETGSLPTKHRDPKALAFSSDKDRLAVGHGDGRVACLEIRSAQELLDVEGAGRVESLAFCDGAGTLVVGRSNGEVHLLDAVTGEPRASLKGQHRSVAVRPGRAEFFMADDEKTVSLRGAQSGELLSQHGNPFSRVTSAAWHPEGRILATGHADRTLRLWDATTWDVIEEFAGHRGEVTSACFDPDGRRIAATDKGGFFCLWELGRTRPVLTQAMPYSLWGAVFGSRGDHIVLSLGDQGVAVLDSTLDRTVVPGAPFNLLAAVDLAHDVRSGPWERDDGILRVKSSEKHSRLAIPIELYGGYRLVAEFVRKSDGFRSRTVGFVLSAGVGRTMLCFDHERRSASGLDQVNGVGVRDPEGKKNPTNLFPGAIEDGRRYVAEIEVAPSKDHAEVVVRLDGKPYLRWSGPQSALNTHPDWETGFSGLGLATGDGEIEFHRLELTMLDGFAILPRRPDRGEP